MVLRYVDQWLLVRIVKDFRCLSYIGWIKVWYVLPLRYWGLLYMRQSYSFFIIIPVKLKQQRCLHCGMGFLYWRYIYHGILVEVIVNLLFWFSLKFLFTFLFYYWIIWDSLIIVLFVIIFFIWLEIFNCMWLLQFFIILGCETP